MSNPLGSRIHLVTGDITQLPVDAIVTAANEALRGGGGVDGAVHRAAGPALVVASRALAPCPAGSSRITPGFNLGARYVVHAVGPVFHDLAEDSATLASAYRTSLQLCVENDVHSIAFPCISTGVYGFPKDAACQIAVDTVTQWLGEHTVPSEVTFCCFAADDADRYRKRLAELSIES